MKAVPEKVSRAVKSRLDATRESQSKVEEAVRQNRPLDAEEDTDRKVAYIQRAVQVDRGTAARIASYEDPKVLRLTPAQRSKAESIQGGTVDFVSICFLDVGRAASRSVARVALPNRTAQGTGFLVSPELFLTNQHVIASAQEARQYVLEFNYEVDANLQTSPVTRFALDPGRFFLFDPDDDLDFALVAVGQRIDGPLSLVDCGFLPLLSGTDKHMKAIFVNIIQHPQGRPKELVLRENRITARTQNTLIYGSDTLPGSSGSPVFNDDWQVVALHHWGSPYRARLDDSPEILSGNEGIRISSILLHLQGELQKLERPKAALLDRVLSPGILRPSLALRSEDSESSGNISLRKPGQRPEIASEGTVSWVVPLTLSLRVSVGKEPAATTHPSPGDIVLEETVLEAQAIGAPEALKPDGKYGTRRGYNPNFLGVPVPLPKLSPAQQTVAATNLRARDGGDAHELKYQHFSVVMNGTRRLPFFTAVNIDGASVVKINRKTGKVTSVETLDGEDSEAYEKWYDDPRINANECSNQGLYDDPALAQFQRGHLVKRTDPSWGTAKRAIRAQADTFHFTNCAPQHESFNPNKTRWAGVEDWITKESDDEDMRVTVFSGPVLRDNDPQLSDIRVPCEFWKVVVRVEKGKLLAMAILADQGKLFEGEATAREDLSRLPTKLPAEYQCSIAEIERLTQLDFGDLRQYDTFGGAEGLTERRPIAEFSDLRIR